MRVSNLNPVASQQENELISQASTILSNFDFGKVGKVMNVLGWTWFDRKTNSEAIPSQNQLRETALELLQNAIEDGSGAEFMAGGFVAKNEQGSLSLKFVVEEYEGSFGEVKVVHSH